MIAKKQQLELFKQAIETWGKDIQLDILVEECAELINVIQKAKRGRASTSEILDELADVSLMLDQAELIYGSYWYHRQQKLIRLKKRLEEANNEL